MRGFSHGPMLTWGVGIGLWLASRFVDDPARSQLRDGAILLLLVATVASGLMAWASRSGGAPGPGGAAATGRSDLRDSASLLIGAVAVAALYWLEQSQRLSAQAWAGLVLGCLICLNLVQVFSAFRERRRSGLAER